MTREYTRRDAVKMFGATAGTAGLTGCLQDDSSNINNSGTELSEKLDYGEFTVNPDGVIRPLPVLAIEGGSGCDVYRI